MRALTTRVNWLKAKAGTPHAEVTDRSAWDWYAGSCLRGLPPGATCLGSPGVRVSDPFTMTIREFTVMLPFTNRCIWTGAKRRGCNPTVISDKRPLSSSPFPFRNHSFCASHVRTRQL
jgi:hypothetical protein